MAEEIDDFFPNTIRERDGRKLRGYKRRGTIEGTNARFGSVPVTLYSNPGITLVCYQSVSGI
jgi:hypothetical protein